MLIVSVAQSAACGIGVAPDPSNLDRDAGTPNLDRPDADRCLTTFDLSEYSDANGDLARLIPPITAAEITAKREAFSWSDTDELPELNADGQPALHYALILIPSPDAEDILRLAGVHYDAMPLFEEEWAQYVGQVGVVELETDGVSSALYAILPAGAYNAIRAEALAGEDLLGPVILKSPPDPDALRRDGSLSYRYLIEHGFTQGLSRDELLVQGAIDGGVELAAGSTIVDGAKRHRHRFRRFFRRGLIRRLVRGIAHIVRAVVNAIREIASDIRELVVGSREIALQVDVGNVVSQIFDDSQGEMIRAWGTGSGQPLRFSFMDVLFRSRFALERASMDANGFVRVEVPRGRHYGVVIPLKSRDVSLVGGGGIWEKRLVLYGARGLEGRLDDDSRTKPIDVHVMGLRNRDVNIFLQMRDAAAFVRQVMNIEPMRVTVNVPRTDRAQDQMDDKARARTVCGSMLSEYWFIPNISALSPAFSNFITGFWGEYDINMRGPSGLSRQVPTHEYGHWVMCQMMREVAYQRFPTIMDKILIDAGLHKGHGMQSYLAESWADFFASQVTGGVDYFTMAFSSGRNVVVRLPGWSTGVDSWFCNSGSTTPCLEDNVGSATSIRMFGDDIQENIATQVTLWTDAVDGHPTTVSSNAPSNGSSWLFSGTLATPVRGADLGDEAVSLEGADLGRFWSHWGHGHSGAWTREAVYAALARTMRNAGFSRQEICQVFSLHVPSGDCADAIDISRIFDGPPPSRPVGLVAQRIEPTTRGGHNRAQLSWTDVSPASDGFRIRILAEGVTIQELEGDAPTHSVTTNDLPFDAEITFEVRTTHGDEASNAAVATLRTIPEPVDQLTSATGMTQVAVRWPVVKAAEYSVYMRNESTGAVVLIGTTSDAEIMTGLLPENTLFSFWVVTIGIGGEVSQFASDVTTWINIVPI